MYFYLRIRLCSPGALATGDGKLALWRSWAQSALALVLVRLMRSVQLWCVKLGAGPFSACHPPPPARVVALKIAVSPKSAVKAHRVRLSGACAGARRPSTARERREEVRR